MLLVLTWKETLGIFVLLVGMAYTALCIGIPEIRIYWKGTKTKLGTVSSVGVAWFIWGFSLEIIGDRAFGIVLAPGPWPYVIFVSVLAVLFTLGYLMDISEKRKD